MRRWPDLSQAFKSSFGEIEYSLLMYPIARASSLSFVVVFRHQVFKRLKELKDRSQEQEPTGRVSKSERIVDNTCCC